KNDVLDKLLRQESMPEGLGLSLVQMAQNAENDSVWRDYCVQFMDPCYARLAGELPADDADSADQESHQSVSSVGQQEQIREAMFAALDERGDTLAGTALIGLENLSRTYDEFDRELIAEKAVEIAADDLASTESRLTALRLSATGNLKLETGNLKLATVETARELAQTGETVYMRSAAIVTLGEVGTEDDRELLESFALSDNRQIVAAAKMALAKMDAD
uniref:hypothetical protein n=1 Tax=Pontiella sp. TaxID=2837462 RepID=UPI00356A2998